jgi:hypothetical protein
VLGPWCLVRCVYVESNMHLKRCSPALDDNATVGRRTKDQGPGTKDLERLGYNVRSL